MAELQSGANPWRPSYAAELFPPETILRTVWARRVRRSLTYIAQISAEPARYREPSRFDVAMPAGEFFAHLYGLVPGRVP